jgi:DNA primase
MDNNKGSTVSLYEQFIKTYGPEVKRREGNNIRLLCPKCKHKSLSCNIQNGLVYCFHCSFGKGVKFNGAASGFTEEPVNEELHKKVSQKLLELCTLIPNQKEYLNKRGIYYPERYGIVTVPFRIDKLLLQHFSEDDLVASGYFYQGESGYGVSKALDPRRILIPFWQENEVIGIKSRIRPYVDPLDQEPRYICPKGSKIKSKLWYKGTLGSDVIVTEGELCAIAAQEAGFSAIGIPGIAQIATSELQSELIRITKAAHTKRIFIILDTDPGIKNDPVKLQHALTLYKVLPNSCILYLPQDKETEKMDLDLFLSRNSLDDFYYLMERAWRLREELGKGLALRIQRLRHEKGNTRAG